MVLNWVLEHKELYPDPLETVEIIYADFDYPEVISKFVRYMPMNEESLGSPELNMERLYRKCKNYLESKKGTF